jgi:hypothetical protein
MVELKLRWAFSDATFVLMTSAMIFPLSQCPQEMQDIAWLITDGYTTFEMSYPPPPTSLAAKSGKLLSARMVSSTMLQ